MDNFYPGVHPCIIRLKYYWIIPHYAGKAQTGIIYIFMLKGTFSILLIFKNNILKFCNSFTYRNISDILYYVLNVFKNLDIKQEETINFSGLTEKYDDLSSGFSLYVRNIKFSEPSGNFTFSYVFNDTELHRFINLFNVCKLRIIGGKYKGRRINPPSISRQGQPLTLPVRVCLTYLNNRVDFETFDCTGSFFRYRQHKL